MGKLKDKICVDGYNPFGGFNLVLSVVSGGAFGFIGLGMSDGYSFGELYKQYGTTILAILLVAIGSFLLLLFRNRKLKSIPKMIIFSILSAVLGVVVAAIGLVMFILLGTFGGGTSSSGNNNKWKKQFSQTKGEYSTDGQGNFKDQHGNDVYNPQKVEDYNKL
ncbi:MAG: hypothetical protein NC433_17695 [Clostridiales bacterium]|nr:hypothetical protein [Clostridiales bacterium]